MDYVVLDADVASLILKHRLTSRLAAWLADKTIFVTLRTPQQDDLIQIEAVTRGIDVVDGGYLWRGELRLWDNEILMGWYAATDGAVRSKGTMYFVLHPHGVNMSGRWVGLSYDSDIVTGWAAIARGEEEARGLIVEVKNPPKVQA